MTKAPAPAMTTRPRLHRWTPADDEVAADPHLSAAQAAAALGRTVPAVKTRRQVLRGSKPRWKCPTGVPLVPAGHPEWLVAKSCAECGHMFDAAEFEVREVYGRAPYCRACRYLRRRVGNVKKPPTA